MSLWYFRHTVYFSNLPKWLYGNASAFNFKQSRLQYHGNTFVKDSCDGSANFNADKTYFCYIITIQEPISMTIPADIMIYWSLHFDDYAVILILIVLSLQKKVFYFRQLEHTHWLSYKKKTFFFSNDLSVNILVHI